MWSEYSLYGNQFNYIFEGGPSPVFFPKRSMVIKNKQRRKRR